MPPIRVCLTALLLLGSGTALRAADAPAASAVAQSTVSIHDFMFSPMSLQVTAGTTVTWTNLDPEPHTIHSVDDAFRSGALDQNDSFTFKFDKPGTYRYVCSIHPQMVATVVVK
jgi:plastocyanin